MACKLGVTNHLHEGPHLPGVYSKKTCLAVFLFWGNQALAWCMVLYPRCWDVGINPRILRRVCLDVSFRVDFLGGKRSFFGARTCYLTNLVKKREGGFNFNQQFWLNFDTSFMYLSCLKLYFFSKMEFSFFLLRLDHGRVMQMHELMRYVKWWSFWSMQFDTPLLLHLFLWGGY